MSFFDEQMKNLPPDNEKRELLAKEKRWEKYYFVRSRASVLPTCASLSIPTCPASLPGTALTPISTALILPHVEENGKQQRSKRGTLGNKNQKRLSAHNRGKTGDRNCFRIPFPHFPF